MTTKDTLMCKPYLPKHVELFSDVSHPKLAPCFKKRLSYAEFYCNGFIQNAAEALVIMIASRAAVKRKGKPNSVHFPADVKQTELSVCSHVHHQILDYVTHEALSARLLLRPRHPPPIPDRTARREASRKLRAVDRFLRQSQRGPEQCPQDRLEQPTQFRLRLLRFSCLFHYASRSVEGATRRSSSQTVQPASASTPASQSLKKRRQANRERAEAWWNRRRASYSQSSASDVPSHDEDTAETLAKILNQDDRASSGGTDHENEGTEPSLLDVLPLFFSLTAERTQMSGDHWTTSDYWLKLAVEFMLQAFVEQRVRYGSRGSSALLEAFAWGPLTDNIQGDDAEKFAYEDDIFRLPDEDDNSISTEGSFELDALNSSAQFHFVRDQAIAALSPKTYAIGLPGLYEGLLRHDHPVDPHPRASFEQHVWEFLSALSGSIPLPLLTQMEEVQKGSLTRLTDGQRLSNEQTEHLRQVWEQRAGA